MAKKTAEERQLAKLSLQLLRLEREKTSYPVYRFREESRRKLKRRKSK